MKTIFCLIFLVINTLAALAQRYVVDVQQSKLAWTGHAEVGGYAPTGTLHLQQGLIELRRSQISRARIDVDMRTIRHENGQMQTHLRGADFFDVATFPVATFVLQRISDGQAIGQLTIKGVTQPVSFPVVLTQTDDVLHLKGQVTVDRTAFGIKYNSSSFFSGLGDYAIRNTFELAFEVVARQNNALVKK